MNTRLPHIAVQVLICSLFCSLFQPILADNASPSRFARIVLFVPDGTELPANYQDRLHNIATRTESFFKTGIERWGWEIGRSNIFARDDSGKIEVIVARGTLSPEATGHNALPEITEQALAAGKKAVRAEQWDTTVWWTFYHCPNHEVRGFRGIGGRDGGRAINAYPNAEGEVSPDVPIASKSMWALNLKGCIHEFGHALGLPHIGPKPGTMIGNTLMGPINRAFAKKSATQAEEPTIYLSAASAAILAHHPLFKADASLEKAESGTLTLDNLSISETSQNHIEITGKVTSERHPHSVVVLDSNRGYGDYWSRSYTTKLETDGSFSLTLDEPINQTKGSLSLFFCMVDGRNTATGKQEILKKDLITISYKGDPGSRSFNLPQSPSVQSF